MKKIDNDLNNLFDQLDANKRVELYEKDYLRRIKWTFPTLLLTSLISLSILYYTGVLNQMQLIISSAIVLVILSVVQLLARRTRVAALKGDSLILKGIDSKSTVTSIKSIRKAHTYQIFGVSVTRLNYTIDKRSQSSLVFGGPSGVNSPLDQLLRQAKKIKGKS